MNKKCQVFTPVNYVEELLDSVGYTECLYGKKILENSCGDGNILVVVVQRYIDDCVAQGLSKTEIKNGLERDIYGIEIDPIQYHKCIEKLNDLVKHNNIDKVAWAIFNEYYLKWNETIKFQFVPPLHYPPTSRFYLPVGVILCLNNSPPYSYRYTKDSSQLKRQSTSLSH